VTPGAILGNDGSPDLTPDGDRRGIGMSLANEAIRLTRRHPELRCLNTKAAW
jgi:hypothetical protein